jgi:hypothetical protein
MNDPSETILAQRVRIMRIISVSLIMGIVTITGVMAYLVYQNGGAGQMPPVGVPFITVLAALFVAVNVGLSFTLPPALTRNAVRRIAAGTWQPPGDVPAMAYDTDALKLLFVRQTTMVISLALLEGVGFFCAIAYFLEGHVYVLIGVAIVLALMIAEFPTTVGLRAWLERQLDAVRQTRDETSAAP